MSAIVLSRKEAGDREKKRPLALLSLHAAAPFPWEALPGKRETLSEFLAEQAEKNAPAPLAVCLYDSWENDPASSGRDDLAGFSLPALSAMAALRRYLKQRSLPFLAVGGAAAMALQEFALNVAGIPPTAVGAAGIEDLFYPPETPRNGCYSSLQILPESRLAPFYGSAPAKEWHAHAFELNPAYQWPLIQAGLRYAGSSGEGSLIDCLEAREDPFAVYAFYEPWPHPAHQGKASPSGLLPLPPEDASPSSFPTSSLDPLLQAFLAAADACAKHLQESPNKNK